MVRRYEPALDGLRAVAFLMVLGLHLRLPHMAGASRGVDVFFVLSGFLITGILKGAVEAQALDRMAFWGRRARRLLPALAVLLAAYVALAPWLLPAYAPDRWRDAAFAGLYLTDYTILFTDPDAPLAHTWSLAIEEQFYLLWPLALPLLMRLRAPGVALLGLWGVFTVLRIAVWALTDSMTAPYFMAHTHCTGLLLGAALAFAPKLPRMGWLGIALIAWSVFAPASRWVSAMIWQISMAEVGAALLIAHLVQPSWLSRAFAVEPLRRLGLISYAAYLWHMPVARAFFPDPMTMREPGAWPWKLAAAALTIALASVSYVTVERWVRRRNAPTTATATA